MNKEFCAALQMLESEKGISADYLIEKITNAIIIAVKKDYEVADNVSVVIDPEKCKFDVSITKNVVEIIEVPETEILLDEALAFDKKAKIGLPVTIHLETKQYHYFHMIRMDSKLLLERNTLHIHLIYYYFHCEHN